MAPAGSGATLHPFFIETPTGRRFAVHHRPVDPGACRGHVLVVPGFNEELNRCRSMVTLQALAFARQGFGTLVVDLHGTGDSDGDYRDGRWDIWLDDLRAARRWIESQPGSCRGVLGIRLGAMLATRLHAEWATDRIGLALWQPVVDGKLHMNQFLRLRIAARLDQPNLPKETTASMRAELAEGRTIEISGYELHPDLIAAVDAERLIDHLPASGAPVVWLEHVTADNPEAAPPSQKVLQAWAAERREARLQTFTGPQFWHVHERVVNDAVIELTTSWFAQHLAEAAA